jgi:hypothetical protein
MDHTLPPLLSKRLAPTRDYLQGVALVLSALQRAYVEKDPHDWQYGLDVGMRGVLTRPMTIAGQEVRAGLDLVRHKVRLGNSSWSLEEYRPPEILNNIEVWLESHGAAVSLKEPNFTSGARHFDASQSSDYATALWWMNTRFRELTTTLKGGLVSPILLYPHHFDLSLVWFPFDDKRQVAIGFSMGDETITEPYLYLTAYPEPGGFTSLKLPSGTHWQSSGFSGAILPYSDLCQSADPIKTFQSYAQLFAAAKPLFS